MSDELMVGRGDPVYMAHAYLTKVPVPAIVPFVEAYTQPGELVLDPFAGSGMTGVAAAVTGRRAHLSDVSVLGRHIGRNYVNLVDAGLLFKHANEIVEATRKELPRIYGAQCSDCGQFGELAKSVWSTLYQCSRCDQPVNFYNALKAADWKKQDIRCPGCRSTLTGRLDRVGEEPVLDYINCSCSKNQREQPPVKQSAVALDRFDYPRVEISPDREMYKASALGRNGLTTVASFYSARNLAVLTTLQQKIADISDEDIRSKLLFAFTACLTRASKRYQWSKQRPLNAANANYYVAAVFYEWNVFELFERKVAATARSDEWIKARSGISSIFEASADVAYVNASADRVPLPDHSADYVFTDPPFGSNLFYADMALFQEAWLGEFTDARQEAVIDRSRQGTRSTERYERLLTASLAECRRVVKPGGYISMVFGNSTGKIWALMQRAVAAAGLRIAAEKLVVLNKGQRSVKGLASGFEQVATLDLIITMTASEEAEAPRRHVDPDEVARLARQLARKTRRATPSHLYLEILRHGLREGWHLSEIDLRAVTDALIDDGWIIEPKTGVLLRLSKVTKSSGLRR